MNDIINEGRTWPFDKQFADETAYRGYFLSHDAFVVRALDPGLDSNHATSAEGDVLGAFYVKPNFPGRCSHVCNGGFITDPRFRQRGVGRLMGVAFLALARDLGYRPPTSTSSSNRTRPRSHSGSHSDSSVWPRCPKRRDSRACKVSTRRTATTTTWPNSQKTLNPRQLRRGVWRLRRVQGLAVTIHSYLNFYGQGRY